jgi:hypothetical protein
VMHKIRLTNNSKYPLTTAPALLIREGKVLAQAMMTYTSTGAKVDLTITPAIDFQVKKSELETKRLPNGLQENNTSYSRVNLTGKISLTSHRTQATEIEITRYVLGDADTASHDGKIEKINMFENGDFVAGGDFPYWWGWYGWPHWWRITWKVTLQPKEPLVLTYDWHYFWQ